MSILNDFSLTGKVVLISGGKGLYGRQIVRACLEAGAKTYCASRDLEGLKFFKQEMKEEGFDLNILRFDQGDMASIKELKQEFLLKEKKLDVLINNAVKRPMKKGYMDNWETFDDSMKVNATGLFLLTREFGEAMKEKKGGSIINIGSIQGMVGPDETLYENLDMDGFIPDYFFHKGGMINFTKFIAAYYGKYKIRCNCISPGGFETESHNRTFVRRYSERTFLRRMANATDLKGVIVFLASDASVYITGTNIPVDGGYTAK